MSQVQAGDEQHIKQQGQGVQSEGEAAVDFEAGFHDGEEAAPETHENTSGEEGEHRESDTHATEQAIDQHTVTETQGAAAQPLSYTQPAPDFKPHDTEIKEPEPTKRVQIPEDITTEYAELLKLSPKAAAIATEDSAEGETLRHRLANYGADNAMDRADIIMDRRRQQEEERKQQEKAVQAHNAHFSAVMQRELPDIMNMVNDKSRIIETTKFYTDVRDWIGTKSYIEAAPLMEIFERGRDPHAVAGMIKSFISERKSGAQGVSPKHDPNDALAVPGKGAPVAPTGIGDKDDFDAGWNIEN